MEAVSVQCTEAEALSRLSMPSMPVEQHIRLGPLNLMGLNNQFNVPNTTKNDSATHNQFMESGVRGLSGGKKNNMVVPSSRSERIAHSVHLCI